MGVLTAKTDAIMDTIASECSSLSDEDYINVLEEVAAQCEARVGAKREELGQSKTGD